MVVDVMNETLVAVDNCPVLQWIFNNLDEQTEIFCALQPLSWIVLLVQLGQYTLQPVVLSAKMYAGENVLERER